MKTCRIVLQAALALACANLLGCVVYVDDSWPRRRYVVEEDTYPAPQAELAVSEDDEVHYVVYREYFGCSDEVIATFPYYRRYYGLSYDDIYFINYMACYRGIEFEGCFHSYYYDCGGNYDRLVVAYNVPRSYFFCRGGVAVEAYPAVYQRTYGAYYGGTLGSVTIENREYGALVQMKVGVEYQGRPPGEFFAQVNAHGGNPGQVVVASRDRCGRGGFAANGAPVRTVAQRPWNMSPGQKQAWHSQQNAAVARHSSSFTSAHRDQVAHVQSREGRNPHMQPNASRQTAPARTPRQYSQQPHSPPPQGHRPPPEEKKER